VLGLEPGTVRFVGLEGAEGLDLAREALALQQVPGGVTVAGRSGGAEREIDQRPPDSVAASGCFDTSDSAAGTRMW
jgi:hypothetical protein